MVICLERGADLHTTQLMPLPLTVSCFSKIQIGFTFLVLAHPGSPGQRAVKRVCVCVQGPKLHFSSNKIIDRKPYPRWGHSKLRLQCDNELSCIQVLGSKLSANAKFQNLRDLNSRTFKHLICFQALSRALKFLFQIQAFSRISQACDES